MSRLTNGIREQMARKLVAHRYKDEAKAILHKNRDLFERAYKHCYTADVLKHMEAVRKVFPDAFTTNTIMQVNAGGYNVSIGGQFSSRWVSIEQEKNPPAKLFIRDYWRHNITDEELIREIKENADKKRAFDDVCGTAYHEALSVLNTMTTGKKLAEAWPEAMPVIGDLIPEDQRTLPVVQVAAVNAKFKLPPETAEA